MDSPVGGQAPHSQADTVPSTPALPSGQSCSPPMTGQGGSNSIGPGGASSPNSVTHASSVAFSMQNHGPHNININNNNILACKMQAVKSSTYSSPPPMPSNPENNVCKLIEYRGAKVAAFVVDGQELICLPQAFELFLKHLVGGLHTVYTKLKRLDIVPVVCNVEQVRILRGLGAIQPGVNRCKLLSCKDFDVLYEDCTNSSARPGRPPKRSPSIHASHDTLDKLKKSRLDNGDHYSFDPRLYGGGDRKTSALLNGFPHSPYALSAIPFMPFGHPMMSPPTSMGMAAAAHLGLRPDGSVIKDRSSSDSDLISPRSREDKIEQVRGLAKAALLDSEKECVQGLDYHSDKPLNLNINGHLDLSTKQKSGRRRLDEDDTDDDHDSEDDKDEDLESLHMSEPTPVGEASDKLGSHAQAFGAQLVNGDAQGLSSIETLLLNIQGLLKVAAENARHHERQFSLEKAELKMEVLREREVRENLEKQLLDEQKVRVILQKRLKKEKKARKRLLDQLDSEQKRAAHLDESPKSSPSDPLRLSNDSVSQDLSMEGQRSTSERKLLDSSSERSTHLYESYLQSNNSGTSRFPYLPLVKNDA